RSVGLASARPTSRSVSSCLACGAPSRARAIIEAPRQGDGRQGFDGAAAVASGLGLSELVSAAAGALDPVSAAAVFGAVAGAGGGGDTSGMSMSNCMVHSHCFPPGWDPGSKK